MAAASVSGQRREAPCPQSASTKTAKSAVGTLRFAHPTLSPRSLGVLRFFPDGFPCPRGTLRRPPAADRVLDLPRVSCQPFQVEVEDDPVGPELALEPSSSGSPRSKRNSRHAASTCFYSPAGRRTRSRNRGCRRSLWPAGADITFVLQQHQIGFAVADIASQAVAPSQISVRLSPNAFS